MGGSQLPIFTLLPNVDCIGVVISLDKSIENKAESVASLSPIDLLMLISNLSSTVFCDLIRRYGQTLSLNC